MIHETVGDFWFAVLSILAIVGPLAAFAIGLGIAKKRGYSVFWVVVTIILTLVAIAFALAFMFTQWTISAEPAVMDTYMIWDNIPAVFWTGFGIVVAWVLGGLGIAAAIDKSK